MGRGLRGVRAGVLLGVAAAAATLSSAVRAQQLPPLDPARALTQYALDSWTDEHGLPQLTVTAVARTPDGYLWVGTLGGGLARFDGVRFTVFARPGTPALPSNFISHLTVGADSSLWIGTGNAGLARLKHGAITWDTSAVPATAFVRDLELDGAGTLWVATQDLGLIALGPGGRVRRFGTAQGLPHREVADVAPAPDGGIWAGTRAGLAHLPRGENRFRVWTTRDGLPADYVQALFQAPDGTLWIGTPRGLAVRRGQRIERVGALPAAGPVVNRLLVDAAGTVWVGTNGAGLVRRRGNRTDTLTEAAGLANNLVRQLFIDRDGSLWLGLSGGGLARLRETRFTPIGKPEGLATDLALAVLEARDGTLWIGTGGGGLHRIRGDRLDTLTTRQGLAGNVILALAEDSTGRIWVGSSGGGLTSIHHGAVRREPGVGPAGNASLQALLFDRTGALWIGTTAAGLERRSGSRREFFSARTGLASDAVTVLAEGPDGALWVGTRAGLSVRRGNRWTSYTARDGLPHGYVRAVVPDTGGVTWIGTLEGGLSRLHDGRIVSFGVEDGLPDVAVSAIIGDGLGSLWVGTPRGVARIPLADLAGGVRPLRATVFDRASGLRTAQVNAGVSPQVVRRRDGTLVFSTPRGAALIRPATMRMTDVAPPVVIERLVADGVPVPAVDGAVVPAGTSRLVIEFTAPALEAPARIRFQYRLVGVDPEWTEVAGARSAQYTHLPPRRLRFEVRAAGEDGVMSPTPASLEFRVRPLLYQRRLVQAVALAGLAALFWTLYRRRVESLHVRARQLQTVVDDRTRAEERYRALFDNALDAVFTVDLSGRITSLNRATGALLGLTAESARAVRVADLLPDSAAPSGDVRTILPLDSVREMEFVATDGTRVPLEASARAIVEDGVTVGVQVMARDLRPRRALEAQFLQAQKMETVGRLAGGVAHDFNNLLTVINSAAELAAMQLPSSDAVQADLAEIRRAGARGAALTRQLLAFSRQQVLQPRVVNLTTLIAELRPLLARLIGEDIALPVTLAEDLANVRVDPGQMEQVIVNLAANARDAMPQGGTLTIEARNVVLDEAYCSLHPSVRPGPHVMLAVSDTGIGMDEATRLRVFEPFFTTKAPGKGSGLGLATVYGIVQQSGGSIFLYSETGRGTTFKIYLPAVVEPASAAPRSRAGVAARGSETILVVEDEELVRGVAQRVLERAGYTVLLAADGAQALQLLEHQDRPVHLVLTDVVMPGMSGRDLAERLRASHASVRILYTSGYTDDAILRHGVLDQGVHFIAKPYSIAELTQKVREVLDA